MNNQTETVQKQPYNTPVLEQQQTFVAITGVSLPIGSNVLDGETE